MRYGDLVRDALRISWRNKFLWVFGIFAAGSSFSGGGGGGGNSSGNQQDFGQIGHVPGEVSRLTTDVVPGLNSASGAPPASFADITRMFALQSGPGAALIVGIVAAALLVFAVLVALNLISQGALAESVAAIKRGETRGFGRALRAGLSNLPGLFVQLILVVLISTGLVLLIALVAGLPILLTFVLSQSTGLRVAMAVVFGLLGVLLFIVVFVPFVIISQLAVRDRVVGENGAAASIGSAYRLFRANLGSSLLVWLLNLVLKIAAGIAFLVVVLLAGLVLIGPGVALYFAASETAGVVVGIVGGLVFLVLFLIALGAVGTFSHSYWTLAYLQLTGRDGLPADRDRSIAV